MWEKDLLVGALNDVYGEFLSAKQRRIISAYFDEDLSLTEIAENEGITRQAVLDLIKRTSEKLYGWEKNCGYLGKFRKLKELSEIAKNGDITAIANLVKEIEDI